MLNQAADEARRLRQNWLGPEHYLLAVLAGQSDATRAMAELGLTHDRAAALIDGKKGANGRRPRFVESRGTATNPAAHDVSGWAAGFAAASGRQHPTDTDWLLAVVFVGNAGWILHELGVSAAAVVEALRRRGLQAPPFEPVEHRPWRGYRTVEVERSEWEAMVDIVGQRHPPGSEWRWGFNSRKDRPGKVQFVAEEGIDLEAIVAAARATRPERSSPSSSC